MEPQICLDLIFKNAIQWVSEVSVLKKKLKTKYAWMTGRRHLSQRVGLALVGRKKIFRKDDGST